ncbi:response regulator transcription factor [Acidocella aminolytica]|jgi:DNA-binding NarL/FixJ family response regulator|uniref:Two component transcriptional regulator LuxR n=1 Tax=Acidocella aminolytica 101 = DSM 11237 TaxID=1120923 RepID=A0A0D6PHG0_9PROT|nr:response regulator transcription factor [Acidocella aminolytica]GAN81200.1 two component transcriptional regulator LuxR [Acidocella aminolytica 101 = DSM 11237]GBQ41736.1 two component response regulator [Acidocella aminolytica 101 = DSM 11237]SHF52616.1 two component transcriptional regulator, LuxR family [Acidocella aminolytica 101 = DSM 11237]
MTTRRDLVLVIDDTPETLGMLTDALETAGLTALVASSGQAALETLRHVTPDLILLDAMMPGLDGFETCRALKALPALSPIPVIFMTGLSDTAHVVRGLEAGGVDYVTKPIVIDELLARIRVHLGNAREALRTRAALDAAGGFLLAADEAGGLLWCTPQAEQRLADALPGFAITSFRLPAGLEMQAGERTLNFSLVGRVGPGERLYRLTETGGGQEEAFLQTRFALSAREAEVLLWVARGKPNKDISDILGISPRTVNKHLEQVFIKLGVENRASAAALTVGELARRG